MEQAVDKFHTDYFLLVLLGNIYRTFDAHIDYQKSVNVYEQALHNAQDQSFLWAYLSVPQFRWQFRNEVPIASNEHLINSFLWPSFGAAYKGKGDLRSAINVYKTVIQGYKKAIDGRSNNLMWSYIGVSYSVFSNSNIFIKNNKLPNVVLWSALGEAYKVKSETEKAGGNSKHATEDIENSIDAFRHALEIEQDNAWIQRVLEELNIALADLTGRIQDCPGIALDIRENGLLEQRSGNTQQALNAGSKTVEAR